MTALHPRTIAILNLITCHSETGITSVEMAAMMDEPLHRVQNSVETLVNQRKVSIGGRKVRSALWIPYGAPKLADTKSVRKAKKTTGLVQPMNGPGHNRKPDPVMGKPAFIPHKNGTTRGDWIPPRMECARSDASQAELIHSRVGDDLVPNRPPASMCVGRGIAFGFAPSRMQQ